MLRYELGDSVFWRSIRKYYAKYAGSIADTRDLQKVFEEISGKDLKQFFDQWLYTPGQPQLNISWEYDDVAGRLEVIVGQEQKDIFKFPLEFKIQLASGKSMSKTIDVSKRSVSFEIYIKEKVTRLIPDPNTKLLANFKIK
jgi:aminopeptidase N